MATLPSAIAGTCGDWFNHANYSLNELTIDTDFNKFSLSSTYSVEDALGIEKRPRFWWIGRAGYFLMFLSPCIMFADIRSGFIALGIGAVGMIIAFAKGWLVAK